MVVGQSGLCHPLAVHRDFAPLQKACLPLLTILQ